MAIRGRAVAVVGAGVAGLAAAIALAQRGADITVLEAAPELGEVGAGLQIGPNSVAVLEALGLRDAVEAAASWPEAIEIRDGPGGAGIVRLPLGRACVARYGRPYWHLHRADLLDALAAGAAEHGVVLRTGTPAVAVEAGAEGVRLTLGDGGTLQADAALGADGLRSPVRSAHFAGQAPRFTGNVAWRGLAPAARLPPGLLPRAASLFVGPGRHMVAYPLRDATLWNVVAVEERAAWAEEGWSAPGDPDEMRRAFAGWAPEVTALLGAVDQTFLWGLFDHPPLPAWARGRLALIGDACHPMLPFLAQGAAMALEDAWVLGATLDAADDIPAGLAAYEDRRKPRATRVQAAAARNARVYHATSPVLRAGLRMGMRAVDRLRPGGLIAGYDWLYGANVVGMDPTD